MEQEFNDVQANMGRAIPGQSMTNDPENPAPYEQAPMFTTVNEASKYLWDFVTEEEHYAAIMTGLNDGEPVMNFVRVILFNEFTKGTFNPDLMLMMAEPLAFMIIALGERLDIDMQITDNDDEDEEEEMFGSKVEEDKLEQMREASKAGQIPQGFLTDAMEEEMRSLPNIDSLLAAEPMPESSLAEETPEVDEAPAASSPAPSPAPAAEGQAPEPSLMAPPPPPEEEVTQ
jgi:hypothetical protein